MWSTRNHPEEVTLGDGHIEEATGNGTILLDIKVSNVKTQICKLSDVLYAPELSYNLLSLSKVITVGKTLKFSSVGRGILDKEKSIVAIATKVRILYNLNCRQRNERANAVMIARKVKFGTEDTVILD